VSVRIGCLIRNSWERQHVDDRLDGIVVIGIVGLIASALFTEIERLVVPWNTD
jgi:ABC-type nitrate/sulfonate/bicarbonate transport system permease component